MDRNIMATGAVAGALAIILGAFAAHGLKALIAPEQIAVFDTGVKYQMYHALFLLFTGLVPTIPLKAKKAIFILTLSGMVFFSGSIYLLACNSLFTFDFSIIGIITPIGGLLLISAWVILFLNLIKRK